MVVVEEGASGGFCRVWGWVAVAARMSGRMSAGMIMRGVEEGGGGGGGIRGEGWVIGG